MKNYSPVHEGLLYTKGTLELEDFCCHLVTIKKHN